VRGWVWLRGVVGALCIAGAAACGGGGAEGPAPATPPDESPAQPNSGVPDAGPPDAGPPDAGPPDAGPPDAGPVVRLCDPTAGEPQWVLEGESLSARVTCATGLTGADLRFSVAELPAGATFDAASATLRWTTARDQAAVWNLTLREEKTGETGTLKVGVAENGGAAIQDPARYTEELGLPVVHVRPGEGVQLSAGDFKPAEVVYRGRRYAAEAKYRGATSNTFPKRSLTLKFPDEDLFDEPVLGGPFLDRKHVVLISTFNDNSYLRSRLAFDLWNRMAPEHVRIQTYSAVVYLGGRYLGVYTVADHVRKRLMAWNGISKEAELYKHELGNANFSRLRQDGTAKDFLHEHVEKSEGLPEGNFASYHALVAWVSDSDATAFREGFAARLNARDYEDWWIFNTLILGTDSMAKNSYHAYDPRTGGPWRFIPWDLDASLGQNFDTTRSSPTARLTFAESNLLFRKMLQEPAIAGPMRERYRQLLRTELREEVVQGLIDGYVKENGLAARRDWSYWQEWYRRFGGPNDPGSEYPDYEQGAGNFPKWHLRTDFNDYEGEVQYVRDWVHTRWESLQKTGVP
jgi:hypothetical protein